MKRDANDAAISALGGAAASFAMDLVQDGLARVFEGGRTAGDREEEVEAIGAVVRLIGTFAPMLASERYERGTARALHYVFGVGFARAYVPLARRFPVLAAGGGTAFGTALFVLSDRILIPTLKLGRSWDRYSRTERLNALASHLAYGIVLETIRAAAAKRGAR